MTTSELHRLLNRMVKEIGTITVDQDFLDYRAEAVINFDDYGRDEHTKQLHCDCLLLEYTQIKLGLVEETDHIASDYKFRDVLIDNKVILGPYWNISQNKYIWHRNCLQEDLLDYFAFFRFDQQANKPLELKDQVSFKLIEVLEAQEALDMTSRSNYDGRYLPIPKN